MKNVAFAMMMVFVGSDALASTEQVAKAELNYEMFITPLYKGSLDVRKSLARKETVLLTTEMELKSKMGDCEPMVVPNADRLDPEKVRKGMSEMDPNFRNDITPHQLRGMFMRSNGLLKAYCGDK